MITEADYPEAQDGLLQLPITILRGPSSIIATSYTASGQLHGQLRKGDKVSYEDIFHS